MIVPVVLTRMCNAPCSSVTRPASMTGLAAVPLVLYRLDQGELHGDFFLQWL